MCEGAWMCELHFKRVIYTQHFLQCMWTLCKLHTICTTLHSSARVYVHVLLVVQVLLYVYRNGDHCFYTIILWLIAALELYRPCILEWHLFCTRLHIANYHPSCMFMLSSACLLTRFPTPFTASYNYNRLHGYERSWMYLLIEAEWSWSWLASPQLLYV